jgi:hypothetical protein
LTRQRNFVGLDWLDLAKIFVGLALPDKNIRWLDSTKKLFAWLDFLRSKILKKVKTLGHVKKIKSDQYPFKKKVGIF